MIPHPWLLWPGVGDFSFGVKSVVKIKKYVSITHFYADCKSAAFRFDGSNPSSPTKSKSPRAAMVLGLFLVFVGFIL